MNLNSVFEWLKAHPEMVSGLLILAINVANGLMRSKNENVSALGKIFRAILDRLALTTNKDAPGTFKLPGKRSLAVMNGVKKKPPTMPKVVSIIVIGSLLSSGCACWGEKANSKECVILKQIIDCSVGASKDVVAHLIPTIVTLIAGGGANFDAVLQALKSGGFENVGCIMASLEKMLLENPAPGARAFVEQAKLYRGSMKYRLYDGQVYP
jgi:hypothetical protein